MLNQITLMGRMCADPELRRTNNGTAVVSFSIAVERDYKDQSGEKQVDFIDIVAWRGTAEFISKYFAKGRMIVVSGSLQTREYINKENHKRRMVEVLAEHAYFGDSKKDDAPRESSYGTSYGTSYGGAPVNVSGADFDDDDRLPF